MDSAVDRIKQLGGAVHVPPTDVPGISRFSIVADPQMATLALVKGLNAGQAQSAELGALCRVGWEKAFAFYGELFGWQKADAHAGAIGTYQQFSADGETLGGMFTMLERCRELAGRRGARGAAARAVPGRDQRHAGIGVAAVDRGFRGRCGATPQAVAVSGGPL